MNVLLRNAASGFYYEGQNSWVNDRERALDLGTIEDAVEAGREKGFGSMEIVVSFDDPICELVLPVRCNWPSRGNASPARFQGVVSLPPPNLSWGTARLPPPACALRLT
jgi:hypothetical protein